MPPVPLSLACWVVQRVLVVLATVMSWAWAGAWLSMGVAAAVLVTVWLFLLLWGELRARLRVVV
jgi:hypothetical protein